MMVLRVVKVKETTYVVFYKRTLLMVNARFEKDSMTVISIRQAERRFRTKRCRRAE
jgi:hypothetical protein